MGTVLHRLHGGRDRGPHHPTSLLRPEVRVLIRSLFHIHAWVQLWVRILLMYAGLAPRWNYLVSTAPILAYGRIAVKTIFKSAVRLRISGFSTHRRGLMVQPHAGWNLPDAVFLEQHGLYFVST